MKSKIDEITKLLNECSAEERRAVFDRLRLEFNIHPIEDELNVQAEVILQAIHRASDLSLRGVRGLIAEASFEHLVISQLKGWQFEPIVGDMPFDFRLNDLLGSVRVQVKMQRLENKVPKLAKNVWRQPGQTVFVVETQKTRTGKTPSGDDTRPYKFGDFDIIAVSMHPSTRDWSRFHFTVGSWLLPSERNSELISTLQPVPEAPDDVVWTADFVRAVSWFRSGQQNRIWRPGAA